MYFKWPQCCIPIEPMAVEANAVDRNQFVMERHGGKNSQESVDAEDHEGRERRGGL